jgi:hypothetical protein
MSIKTQALWFMVSLILHSETNKIVSAICSIDFVRYFFICVSDNSIVMQGLRVHSIIDRYNVCIRVLNFDASH